MPNVSGTPIASITQPLAYLGALPPARPLDTLEIVAGIEEAIRTLKGHSIMLVNGATPIFMKVVHAKEHLEKEITALLAPDPDAPAE